MQDVRHSKVGKIVCKDGYANGAAASLERPHRLRDFLRNYGHRPNIRTGGAACKAGALPAELPPRRSYKIVTSAREQKRATVRFARVLANRAQGASGCDNWSTYACRARWMLARNSQAHCWSGAMGTGFRTFINSLISGRLSTSHRP